MQDTDNMISCVVLVSECHKVIIVLSQFCIVLQDFFKKNIYAWAFLNHYILIVFPLTEVCSFIKYVHL